MEKISLVSIFERSVALEARLDVMKERNLVTTIYFRRAVYLLVVLQILTILLHLIIYVL